MSDDTTKQASAAPLTPAQRDHILVRVYRDLFVACPPAREGEARTVAGASVTVSQAATSPAEQIELRGELSGLAGQCPNLTFTLQGTLVLTNAQTVFDERCDRVRNRRDYIVSGLVQADGRVLAVRVREN